MREVAPATDPGEPSLLICGFGPFPAAPANPAAAVVETLRDGGWRPRGAQIRYAVLPTLWNGAYESLQQVLSEGPCSGVLLVGVAVKAEAFRVEMRAQNRTTAARADAAGAVLGRDRIDPTGPAVARVTAPVAEMLDAIRGARLPAQPSSDAGAYLCNYTLYRVLTACAGRDGAPSAGFLHVPSARELAGPDAASDLPAIARAVRAAAQAYADVLSVAASPALV